MPVEENIKKIYPADLLKFSAWREIVDSYETAVSIILKKKPVLGEPTVVPFYYSHEDNRKTVELAIGVGSMDPEHPYISSSIILGILNDAVIREIDPETGEPVFVKLGDLLQTFINRDEAREIIREEAMKILEEKEFIDLLVQKIIETGVVEKAIEEKLRWKPFPISSKWVTLY